MIFGLPPRITTLLLIHNLARVLSPYFKFTDIFLGLELIIVTLKTWAHPHPRVML